MIVTMKIMHRIILITVFISICYSDCTPVDAECPPEDVTKPCHCKGSPKILTCDITDFYDITEVTRFISINYNKRVNEKYFDKLKMENINNGVKVLSKDCFNDLSFGFIYIHSEGLEKIHEDAFNHSRPTLKQLYISTNKYLASRETPYNIFKLVNSMPNLSDFLVRGETSINQLPSNTLNSSSIRSIAINLNTLNDNSYNLLPNIANIELRGSFNFVPSKAFVVENHNSSSLKISFSSTQISGSSLESGVFTNTNRTLHLEFNNNKNFKYLSKHIFGPLFDKFPNSTVTFSYNPLDCNDCNIKWIVDGKHYLNGNIIGAECEGEIPVFNLTKDDLNYVGDCNHPSMEEKYIKICGSIGLVFFCLFAIISTISIVRSRKKKKKKQKVIRSLIEKNQIWGRNSLNLKELLGEGNFGCVYRALLNIDCNDIEVAVKTVKSGCDEDVTESFFKEGILLIDFKHERVLTPIGVCFENNSYPMIILPLMANGDLLSFLRRRDVILTVRQLHQFTHQIAEGMVYLSSKNFVHRDLAARNCLVDGNMCVKIGDFGLSRYLYAKHYYRSKNKIPLPYKWMAPECIEKGYYDSQTDVWSFGVLVWEILSKGSDPYPNIDNANILNFIKSNGRLPQPKYCSNVHYKLLSQCWSIKPQFRPNFPFISDFTSIQIGEINQNIVNSSENCLSINYEIPVIHV